ncbi:hypothetical protein ABT084_13700 [Streptomyces sp. NPDC002138]|uniref:hypothetical protein n=1 Tax=Streptomyces sp. NPDC002138 TaxID=3154410 RepID=UPI0033235E04
MADQKPDEKQAAEAEAAFQDKLKANADKLEKDPMKVGVVQRENKPLSMEEAMEHLKKTQSEGTTG